MLQTLANLSIVSCLDSAGARRYSHRPVLYRAPISDRARTTAISLLFVLPFLVVGLQSTLIHRGYGEPYPAIMMPGFQGSRTDPDGTIRVTAADVEVGFVEGNPANISVATLLAPLPISMVAPTSAYMFRARPVTSLRPPTGLKASVIDHLMPIRTLRLRRMAAGNPPSADTVAWLRHRVSVLFPTRQTAWVEIHWFRDKYRRDGSTLERVEHIPDGTYTIDLTK
jgi:hypothetical protein